MKVGITKTLLKNRTTKKQHVLILFLLISALFWLLTKLSKEYETKVIYNVVYSNLPSSKLFQNTPKNQLELYIRGTGFKLLEEQMRTSKLKINLRNVVSNGGYQYYLVSKSKTLQIQNQLGKSIQLKGFVKDTLFFELGFNKHKKIPVIPNLDFRFKSGYNLSNKVYLVPDSIQVNGPEIQVDKISSISTGLLRLEDIVEDVHHEIPLLKPEGLDKLNFNVDVIQVVAEVEKFTEDSFEVPFVIEGLPKGTKITTYPKNVKIVFQVGLSNYKKISANDFKIVCSYEKAENDDKHYLLPRLVEKPNLVSATKLVPNRIEYLIQK